MRLLFRFIVIPSSTPSDPAPPQDEPPTTQQDNPQLAIIKDAALAAFQSDFKRAVYREVTHVRAAVKKTLGKGNHDGFKTWTDNFYAKTWPGEIGEMLGPAAGVLAAIGDGFGRLDDLCNRYAVSSRAQLAAVLRDEGPEGVTKRLEEWEQTREFCNGQN